MIGNDELVEADARYEREGFPPGLDGPAVHHLAEIKTGRVMAEINRALSLTADEDALVEAALRVMWANGCATGVYVARAEADRREDAIS
jgi:hypothetical protein